MYDAVVIGAGISGSISAKILAQSGYKILLLDRMVPPRDKVCSGVQLRYMEKLIGKRIPDDILCSNKLRKVRVTTPSGKSLKGSMALLNYWRRNFDYWLNGLALDAGAETSWGADVTDIELKVDKVIVKLGLDEIEAKYVIGADGLSPSSFSRKWLKPDNFSGKVTGSSLNYYFKGESEVQPDTLYLYYRTGLSDLMYSWLYYKDDLLVVGTSSTEKLNHYARVFLETVRREFSIKGEKIGQDGYSTQSMGGILLGRGRVLLVGDAAGFLDLYRGVGMDTAALSGRICAQSIIDALEYGKDCLSSYRQRSRRLVQMIEKNKQKQEERYISDKALEFSLSSRNIFKSSLIIAWANLWNRLCKPEELILLPP